MLAGPAGENGNSSGDLDILDVGDLTFEGNGAEVTIISGGGVDRVFHICPGGSCTTTVTFNGVTGGGGIRHEAGTAIVDASSVQGNTAINGGGISNFATLSIQNSSLIGGSGAANQAVVRASTTTAGPLPSTTAAWRLIHQRTTAEGSGIRPC